MIAQTPTDFVHFLQAGLDPWFVTGLLWGGLEEEDYLRVNRQIGGLTTLDPTSSGWKAEFARRVAAQTDRRVVVITDVDSFRAGLEQLGFSSTGLEEATRAFETARETLSRMQ